MSGLLVLAMVTLFGLTVLVRLAEPFLAFYPFTGETRTPAEFGLAFDHVWLRTADSETVHGWWLPDEAARATVVYFHGNGGNLSLWNDILAAVRQRGLSVLAIDYRGYGRSTGRPTEAGVYRDADAVVQWLAEARPTEPVVYWGRSLGVPVAAYAASRRPPDGLIFEAGFPDVRTVLASSPVLWLLSWLGTYRFPTVQWMREVRVPVLVVHGDRDSIVPYRAGRRLFEALPEPKRFVTIRGGDHNDAEPAQPDVYWAEIDGFIDALRERP